jgi:hypothetical protein
MTTAMWTLKSGLVIQEHLPQGWVAVFYGYLETEERGFDAGTATASTFYIDAAPGTYHVRVEAHHDSRGDVDAVRCVFPHNDDLTGHDV